MSQIDDFLSGKNSSEIDSFLSSEPQKPSGALRRGVADKALGFASGAVGATKALADVAGAGNVVSNTLDAANKGINDYLSPEAKADQQEQSALMDEAKGKGVWEGVKAGAKAFAVAPVQTAVQGLGSIVPIIAGTAMTGGVAPAAAAGAGIGAAMGAGTAKGAIYDEIKKRGGTEEEAIKAQEYGGVNTDQIALGGALGTADALTGVSKMAGDMVRGALRKPLTEAATKTVERGVMGRAGMGMLSEMPLEAAQGGQEQVAANLAAQRAGYEAGTWDNVASNATLESLASAGPGAAFGAASGRGAIPAKPAPEQPPAVPPEQPPVSPDATLALPPPNIIVGPDGSATTAQDRNERLARIQAGDVTDVTPIIKQSEQMGLTPTVAPSLTNAAITAVDTGVHQQQVDQQTSEADQAAYDAHMAEQDTTDKPITHGDYVKAQLSEADRGATLMPNEDIHNADGFPYSSEAAAQARQVLEGKLWEVAPTDGGWKLQKTKEPDAKQTNLDRIRKANNVSDKRGIQPIPSTSSGSVGNQPPASVGLGTTDGNGVGTNAGGLEASSVGEPRQSAGGVPESAVTWDNIKPGQQVTLYRGESAANDKGGQWWTTDKAKAERYGNVTAVTLPSETVGKHSVRGHNGADEFVFPTESNRPNVLAEKAAREASSVATSGYDTEKKLRFAAFAESLAGQSKDAIQKAIVNSEFGAALAVNELDGVSKSIAESASLVADQARKNAAPQAESTPAQKLEGQIKFQKLRVEQAADAIRSATDTDRFGLPVENGPKKQSAIKRHADAQQKLSELERELSEIGKQDASAANRAKLKAKNTPTIKTEIVPDIPQPTESTNEKAPEAQQVQAQPEAGTTAGVSEPAAVATGAGKAEGVEAKPATPTHTKPKPYVLAMNQQVPAQPPDASPSKETLRAAASIQSKHSTLLHEWQKSDPDRVRKNIGSNIVENLGKNDLNYELIDIPVESVIPSQEGEDYLNSSSKYTAKQIADAREIGDMRRKDDVLPIILDDKLKIKDGNHRHAASVINKSVTIPALVPVGPGTGKVVNYDQYFSGKTKETDTGTAMYSRATTAQPLRTPAPTNVQEGIAAAQAKAARFAIGKSLTKEQRKQVLESLVDTYKTKGAEREFKGQDSNGNDRYGYAHSPELFEKSDITGAMVRYYVTLPDGRIAHPTELFPDVSASDVERMALEQESKKKAQEAYENAIKPFYPDFDSANLMATTGQVVISKGDRLAIIPDRTGAVGQARQQGWEIAKQAQAATENVADSRPENSAVKALKISEWDARETAPIGTWVKADYKLADSQPIYQVRELPLDNLYLPEAMEDGRLQPEKRSYVNGYADRLRAGETAPGISVIEMEDGRMRVVDGHRRVMAARAAGRGAIRALVSPLIDTPSGKQEATIELLQAAQMPPALTSYTPADIQSQQQAQQEQAAKAEAAAKRADAAETQSDDFVYNGVRIYKAKIKFGEKVEDRWAVESADNKQRRESGDRNRGGDSLFATIDEAKADADRQIKRDAQKEESAAQIEQEKKSQDELKKALESDNYNGFLDGLPENRKALVRKALSKELNFQDGGVMTIRARIEGLFSDGNLEPSTDQVPVIQPMSRAAFNRATQREQDAHEKKMREAGTKTEYLVNGSLLGKTGYDYSKHLLSQKQEPAAQATAILDAADITGKERIDALKDVKKGDITPDELKAAYPAKASEFSSIEKELQSKATKQESDGSIGVVMPGGDVQFVLLADAVKAAEQAIANGTKAVPFQIHNETGIRLGDTDRVIAAIGKPDNSVKPEAGGMQFSRTTTGTPTLIIQHNLTEENLLHADRMGGIPVPSLAITQAEHPLVNFGEITLLGGVDMANPKGYAATKVFGADIYSPRYPRVTYGFTDKMKRRGEAMLKDGIDATGTNIAWGEVANNGADELRRTPAIRWQVLTDNGLKPEIIRTEAKPLPKAMEPFANDNRPPHELAQDPAFIEAAYKAHEVDLVRMYDGDAKAAQEELAQLKERANERGVSYLVRGYANDVQQHQRDTRSAGAIDRQATNRAMEVQIEEAGLRDKLEVYSKEYLRQVNPDEKLFQGFTNMGNRKYIPHTLDNVIKILKKDMVGGEGFNYGVGSVRSRFTPQFKSIAEIQKAKGRLMDEKAFDLVKEEVNNELSELSNALRSYHDASERFGFGDTVTSTLSDSAKMGLSRALTENGFKDVPQEVKEQIAEFLGKLRNMPTAYFEAKILRAVDVSEFKGAVVPTGTSQKAIDALARRGITNIKYYDKSIDGDRAAKIQELAKESDLLFSRANTQNPTTVQALQSAIRDLVGAFGGNKLGRIVATTAADIKSTWEPLIGKTNLESEGNAGKAQAFYDPKTNTVFLIADHIEAGNETAVLAHELMHKWGKQILGEAGWNKLHSVISSWADAKEGSQERQVYDQASAAVDRVGVELSSEELFPYAVEAAIKMGIKPNMMTKPGTVTRWLAEVRNALKQVWEKIIGKPDTFKAQDLVNLAFGIAQMENPKLSAVGGFKSTGQTDTPAFRKWFGDSKVVDAEGKPLVVYHGTGADFEAFDKNKSGAVWNSDKTGFFFSSEPVTASEYADFAASQTAGAANVMPVYVSLKNPLTLEKFTELTNGIGLRQRHGNGVDALTRFFDDERDLLLRYAKQEKNDGILLEKDGKQLVVAFRPEQIKSATGNNGDFDGGNPDIRFSRGTNDAVTNQDDVVGNQGGRSADDTISRKPTEEQSRAYDDAISSGKRREALRVLHEYKNVQADVDASVDRGGAHSPSGPEDGSPLYDVSKNGTYPEDVYSHNGLKYYSTGEDVMDREAHSLIKSFEAYPNKPVNVYRAVYKDEPSTIDPGAWVTTVRQYAKDHGENALNGDYKIVKKLVHARDIFTSGDSWLEWGYHPQEAKPSLVKVGDKYRSLEDYSAPNESTAPDSGGAVSNGRTSGGFRIGSSSISYSDASPQETAKVEAGIKGKSLVDAARFIQATGTPSQSMIAEKIVSKLERLQASGVNLKLIVAKRGDSVPSAMGRARGYTETGFDSKGRDITVWIAGSDVTGRVGTDYETVLHELVHAATTGVIEFGKSNPNSLAGKHVRELNAVTSAISSHLVDRFTKSDEGKTELTEFEKDIREFANNAFRGVDEVVSWAMTSRDAQSYLEAIPYKSANLWTSFVQSIRNLLGLPANADTALSEVIRITEHLVESDLNDHSMQAFWHKRYIRMSTVQAANSIVSKGGNSYEPENLGHPNIRFSRSISDTLTSAANSVRDGLTKATVTDLNRQFGNRLSDFRGLGLQTLGRRQLVDLYAGDLPQMEGYSRMVAQMDADKNESGAEADALATGWGKLKDERQLAELMHDATLAQIDPDKSYVTGDDQNFYDALRDGFDRLTPEAKAAYRKARDMYSGHNDKVREAIRERIMRSEMSSAKKQALLTKMEGEFFKKVKGVYFPLARFGQYVTIVKDSNGDVVSANRSETMNEAEATRKILIAKFPASGGWKVGKVLKDKEFNAARDGVGRGFMADLFETLDKTNAGDELTDAISQLYLAALPDLSWAKHGIHRKGTPGFSQDARRAFAQNMFHGARYLAKLRYADQLQVSLDDMQTHIANKADVDSFDSVKAQQVVDEMVKRHDSMMNPQTNPISTALTSFGFVFHLGLSPASALVNLSQTALVAYPVMGSKWGFGKASAALLDASRQAAGNKNDISKVLKGDELVAYNEAVRSGVIDVTMAHDLAGIAQGEDSKVSAKIRPVMKAASFLFHHAEKFNRQVTFVAAYRLSRDAGTGHQVAYEQAVKATYDGHFDYSASNRPRVMQGNVAKVVLLFKQYAQNMIYTLTRQAQLSLNAATPKERAEARKALSGLLVSHALAAGAFGLPMVGMLLGAASAIGGDDDEPWDAKVALQNMLADTLGQKPAEVLAHGLSRLTPWDISGRVGLDKLLLPDVQEGLQGSDAVKNWMASALGPVAGIAVNAGKGMQDIANGQYIRGMESMLPSALRSPLKAYRYGTEGNIDKTGVAINDEVSAAGVAGQALGFSPSETRLAQEGKSAIYSADRAIQERRSSLTRQFALAAMAKDQEGMADARKDIERFNEKNPKARITPVNLMQSVHARRKRIEQSEQGVYLPKKRQDAIDAGRFAVVD